MITDMKLNTPIYNSVAIYARCLEHLITIDTALRKNSIRTSSN